MKISFPDDNCSNILPRITKFDSYIALGMGLVRIDFGSNRLQVKVTGGHFVKVTVFFLKCNNFGIFKARVARFHTHIVLTIFFSFYYFLISHDLVEIGLKTVTGVSKFKFKIT